MTLKIHQGDCRAILGALPAQSVHCCVTSPPYFGLRDYGSAGQIGLEPTPAAYVAELVAVFREVRRVLRDDGTLWLNLGDSYAGGGGYSPGAPSNRQGSKQSTSRGSIPGMIRAGNPAKNGGVSNRDGLGAVAGLKSKDLIGIPWRVAFALQADGWYLRQDIIWSKPNPMPESVTDRCTKAHEYIFLMSKAARYYYDAAAIAEPFVQDREGKVFGTRGSQGWNAAVGMISQPQRDCSGGFPRGDQIGRNKRSVWEVASQPFAEAHFATFPPDLIEPCILAGCPAGGTVLDPFGGAGTTGLVADRLQRDAVLIELNPNYAAMAERRLADDAGMFAMIA